MNAPQTDPPALPPDSPFGGDAVHLSVEPVVGGLRWTADRPNADGVVTELLAARVQSALAEPRDRDYRTVGRAVFVPGGLSADVSLRPGRYAVAVRFVLKPTGQAGGVLRLGVVSAGG